jgi:hypothetical protein
VNARQKATGRLGTRPRHTSPSSTSPRLQEPLRPPHCRRSTKQIRGRGSRATRSSLKTRIVVVWNTSVLISSEGYYPTFTGERSSVLVAILIEIGGASLIERRLRSWAPRVKTAGQPITCSAPYSPLYCTTFNVNVHSLKLPGIDNENMIVVSLPCAD